MPASAIPVGAQGDAMPIDPYSPCPGGTGKKVKFCCADLVSELEKVQRMLEGDQPSACLDYVRKLDETYPGRACLQSIRLSLEHAVGDHTAAAATLEGFVEKHPDNPIALAEQSLALASEGNAREAIGWMQKALDAASQEMPARVYEALGGLAIGLLGMGHVLPARAHLQLQIGISQGRDERALSALLQLEGAPNVPLLLKDMPPLEKAPEGVAWRAAFDKALEQSQRGRWTAGEKGWAALSSQAAESQSLWRNLATVRGFLADYSGAVEALRKYESLGPAEDDAIDAEALAQLLLKNTEGIVDELALTYEIEDADAVQEKLASDRRVERVPFDPTPWTTQNEPPPRAAFALLTKPPPSTGVGITREQVPHQLGEFLLFGKQTDRAARIELTAYRPELPEVQNLLGEILGAMLGQPSKETVVGHLSQVEHALSWHWRLPDDTPDDLRYKLAVEQRRELVLEQWLKLTQPALDGRTAEDAAKLSRYRVRVLAGIWLLQLADSDTGGDTYNALRRKLNLPELTEIDPAGLDINRIPIGRILRLKVDALTDEQLKHAFNRAAVSSFTAALKRLAPEILKRPSMPVVEYKLSAYRLMVRLAINSDEALRLIGEARKLAEENKQSSAPWDLMELAYCIERNEAPAVVQLIEHIRLQHGAEPGVSQALVQLLVQTGLVGPDGRLNIGPAPAAASPLSAPAAAAEPGKLWTPGAPQGGGEKKSSLWLPE